MKAGDVIAARFEIERHAGAGGMGEVFRAIDRLTAAPAAVKVLHSGEPELVARFDREAAVLAELRHPAIVRYLAHGVEGDEPWLAMEWLEGETLGARIERDVLSVGA